MSQTLDILNYDLSYIFCGYAVQLSMAELKVGTGLEINQNYSDIWIRKFKCVSKNPIKKGLKNDFYLDQKWKYFVDCFLQACTRR